MQVSLTQQRALTNREESEAAGLRPGARSDLTVRCEVRSDLSVRCEVSGEVSPRSLTVRESRHKGQLGEASSLS